MRASSPRAWAPAAPPLRPWAWLAPAAGREISRSGPGRLRHARILTLLCARTHRPSQRNTHHHANCCSIHREDLLLHCFTVSSTAAQNLNGILKGPLAGSLASRTGPSFVRHCSIQEVVWTRTKFVTDNRPPSAYCAAPTRSMSARSVLTPLYRAWHESGESTPLFQLPSPWYPHPRGASHISRCTGLLECPR